jgi:hypothetical protein
MRTAAQMKATLDACHEAGDHDEGLELATDLTTYAERTREELAGAMRSLADDLRRAADRLIEDGRVNELGVVQHRGADVDCLCGKYAALVYAAEGAQKAAGLDPNA